MNPKEMKEKLRQQFTGSIVTVLDMTGGGSNFEVRIQSIELKAMKQIDQHKTVMKVFDKELKSGEIHALTIKVL